MSGASSVSSSSRFFSFSSAISAADRYLPSSNILFRRCARASAQISVSSGRGFAGAHASPPSGAMITLRPPRRFQVIGMWTVMRLAVELPILVRGAIAFAFMRRCLTRLQLLDQRLQPLGPQPHLHAIGRQVDPLDQQPDDPRLLGRNQCCRGWSIGP